MQLVRPAALHLPSYVAALRRGWSPETARPDAAQLELQRIEADADAFVASTEDRQGRGPPITLPDGSLVPRLPGFRRWMWAGGEFIGSIGLRWQPGTAQLPPHCLGHIGYSVVPWHRGRGHATSALRQMLPQARAVGLPFVEITTDPDNLASQKVIQRAGGRLCETFFKPPQFGGTPALRYRIDLGVGR